MSVLVKGMEMPEKCGLCDLFHAESPMHCTVVKGHKTVGAPYGIPRPEWCPLVALPDHHGRLVDADEMLKRLQAWNTSDRMDKALYNFAWHRIMEQPTIVEAEGENADHN